MATDAASRGDAQARSVAPPPAVLALVLALATALLLVVMVQGLRSVARLATGNAVRGGAAETARFSCLERELHREVQRGATVAVSDSNSSLYKQRLTEWMTGWGRVVADRAGASVVVSVRGGTGGCGNHHVVVSPA